MIMNSIDIADHHNEIVESIVELSMEIEEDYLLLAGLFKEIFHELDDGFKTANIILKINQDVKEKNESKNEVDKIVDEVKDVVKKVSKYFLEMNEKDILLYSSVNKNIEQLNVLKSRIDAIREDTTDLEVLSINAMTVAIKAGIEGKGFSFITEELKKLSTKTISYTSELSKQGNKIITLFTDFQNGLLNLKNFQEKFYSTFNTNLDDGFNNFSKMLVKIEKMVSDVIEKAQWVSKPIFRIMDEIQFQDIIKQSLEHVIMSLKEMQTESQIEEESINKYAIIEVLSEISINLLSDVELKIMNCFTTYKSNFTLLREILDNIDKEKKNFINKAKEYKITDILNDSTKIINQLIDNIKKTLQQKNGLSGELKIVKKDLDKLIKHFKKYFEIIDRFFCIEIVSRIEIEKREKLRNRKEIIIKMGRLTIQIEKDIKEAMVDMDNSNECSKSIANEYMNSIKMEFSVALEFINKIKSTEDMLIQYNEKLQNSINNFTLYSDNFFHILEEAETKIKKLFERADRIASVKNKLYDLNNNAGKRKKELLKLDHKKNWNIKDSKIIEMVNKFTILTHKQLAGDIVGVSFEKGDKAGELTLF